MRCSSRMMMRLIVPVGVCLAVAGCSGYGGTEIVGHEPTHLAPGLEPGYVNYADRTDQVSLSGGNAMAFNKVVQTEHPWPRYVRRTHIHMDGEVADLAIDRYKSGNVKEPESLSTTRGATGGG